MKTDSAVRPVRLPVVWNDSPGVSEKQLRLRQSFQSARPMSGRPWGPRLSSTWWNERFRCSKSDAASFGSLSKGTVSFRIPKSPDSLDVRRRPRDEPERVVVEARTRCRCSPAS